MFELDRTRSRKRVKKLHGKEFSVLHTNGKHCIVRDSEELFWMSVPVADGVLLYPMQPVE